MKNVGKGLIIVMLITLLGACTKSEPEHSWLSGDEFERIDTVAEHLRGNDLVMWEVQYRHKQLYEAIISDNPEFAVYQLKKIEVAMRKGMERRPKRKASYEWFFQTAIPVMEDSLKNAEGLKGYKTLTGHCIQCHGMENVAFMPVATPWKDE